MRRTDYVYKVMDSKVKVTDNIFQKCTFSAKAYGFSFEWLVPIPFPGACPCTPLEESQITSQDKVGSTNFITLPAPLLVCIKKLLCSVATERSPHCPDVASP